MSQQPRNDWGEMVLPGVYMLRRTTAVEKKLVGADAGNVQIEIILHDIEVMQNHINKLKETNDEIREYIKNKGSLGISERPPSPSGHDVEVCDPTDNITVFKDALVENEIIISSKERELEELKRLIQPNRCACHYHSDEVKDVECPSSGDVRDVNTREEEEEEEEEKEEEEGEEEDGEEEGEGGVVRMSNALFYL
ncbi:uncharacterized protein TM35_000231070 [Trypanosoma theileri]|uniref:Uncharacterized protein n=1 Tax=Trypanosoma theileri TaxID=67003 RepID=A0A1X0NQZ0_9TRYP|nr:uncharacterized protein TM35_000231070 [Trypanosoma theileri]ORC87136.1 hypothetical protein TM35_000231070 [Trypanosoma theileri]